VPPDLAALSQAVAIYAENDRFGDAEDSIEGVLGKSRLDAAALSRVAALYGSLAQLAERAHADDPHQMAETQVIRLAHRAQVIAALSGFREHRDHGPVGADLTLTSGTRQRLGDVMLECSSNDLASSPHGTLAVSYFGDRLRLDAPAGSGSEPREAVLGEIDTLVVERDPLGRKRLRVAPHSWSRETAACDSCAIVDDCAIVGDRGATGGLERVELDDMSEASFRVESTR
jgi:hypothetical protein